MSSLPPDKRATFKEGVAFEERLRALQARLDVPGIGVTLFNSDAELLTAGYGWRDREERTVVDEETIFGVASITKSFTALSVLLLAAEGRLSLDDAVTDYLPFTLWRGREPARLEHLLSHTSGLPPTPTMTWLRAGSQARDPVAAAATVAEAATTLPTSGEDLASLAASVSTFDGLVDYLNRNVTLLAEPGELFSYSNDAYCLLGGVIEQVSGLAFEEFVTERILTPLGMKRSTFDVERVLGDDNHATIYERDEAGVVRRSPEWQTTGRMLAGGMLKSTLADLRRYARFLMAPEAAAPRDGSWAQHLGVSAEAVRDMARGRAANGPVSRYGLGLISQGDAVAAQQTGSLVGHDGSLKGVSSSMMWAPELGVGVVVLSNLSGVPTSEIAQEALNAQRGAPLESRVYQPRKYAASDTEVADLLGRYASGEPYGRLTLYLTAGGELRAEVGLPSEDVPAFLAGPDEVVLRHPERLSPATVLRNADGSVRALQQSRVLLRVSGS